MSRSTSTSDASRRGRCKRGILDGCSVYDRSRGFCNEPHSLASGLPAQDGMKPVVFKVERIEGANEAGSDVPED